jgi:hypothetical protein
MTDLPPLLVPDYATGRVYVSTKYRLVDGQFTSLEQTDVTESFVAICKWLVETGRARDILGG